MSGSLDSDQEHKHIILFDGVCNLCSGWVGFLLRRPARVGFYFCAVQSPLGQKLLLELELPTDIFDTMVYMQASQAYYKSDAILQVLEKLPRPWCWLYVFRVLPKSIRDWLYDRVAKNRYRIMGKRAVCYRPSNDEINRFL